MLKKFEIRNSAVVYASNLEQVRALDEINPELAGVLAVSFLELALGG